MQAYDDNDCAKKAIVRASDVSGVNVGMPDRSDADARSAENLPRHAKNRGRLRMKLIMPLAACFCCAILVGTLLPFLLRGNKAVNSDDAEAALQVQTVTFDELAAAGIALPDASGFTAVRAQLYGADGEPFYARVTLNGTSADPAAAAVLTIVLESSFAYAAGPQFDDLPLAAAVDGAAVRYRIDAATNRAYAYFVLSERDCFLTYTSAEAGDILTVIADLY